MPINRWVENASAWDVTARVPWGYHAEYNVILSWVEVPFDDFGPVIG